MLKMSITDAAEHFGVSKEAIHNRIRRGSLKSVVEDNIKLVIIDNSLQTVTKTPPQKTPRKSTVNSDDRYYKLLEEQNAKLQSRVESLENETKTLREQKEQMLIDERNKIEQIYKDKDEQLKNILNAISSKFMLDAPIDEVQDEDDHLEAEIEEDDSKSELVSLKTYLNEGNFSKKRKEKIKATFKKRAKKDSRIIVLGKKYYIDLVKHDYSDLL